MSTQATAKVVNGKVILPGADGRTSTARCFRDLLLSIESDLGGVEHLSECKRQLARRLALMCCRAEELEIAAASGQPVDTAEYVVLASAITRVASKIGLERALVPIKSKDGDSDISRYFSTPILAPASETP
jgi:hypothetical protein